MQNDPLLSAKASELILFIRDYAERRINTQIIDQRRCIPPYLVLDFGNAGLLGLQTPTQYGGLDLSTYDFLKICEQLSGIDLPLTLLVALHNILGIRPIQNFASQSMKDEWLPRLATGRVLGSFALTEPGAGSNPQGIISSAVALGENSWSVSGHKSWSGSASWASIINVFTKVVDANGKSRGITAFSIPQGSQGMVMGEEAMTMGMRGMVQNSFHLDNVKVDASQMLHKIGGGLEVAQDAMLFGRLVIGHACVGSMKRCVQLINRYITKRKVGPDLLNKNAVVQTKVNDIILAAAALEQLTYQVAQLIDNAQEVPQEIFAACKILGPEMLWSAVDSLMQLLGGRGYIETNIASRLMRDARVFRVFEGPTETMLQFLGTNILYNKNKLIAFLDRLDSSAAISKRLLTDTQQVTEFIEHHYDELSTVQRQQLAANAAGELGAWLVLMAFNSSGKATIGAWIEHKYQSSLMTALSKKENLSDQALFEELTSQYSDAIGDTQESLAGEELTLDSALTR